MNRFFKSWDWPLTAIFALGFLLRLCGARFGLPGPAFADEPHHINIAVSFGSGHFDPIIFKYPSLWFYCLFLSFGTLFVGWSGFGLIKNVSDFAHLFVRDPTLFYLTARFVTALTGSLAVFPLAHSAIHLYDSRKAGRYAALFYAVSPTLIYYAHQAKPDTMMIFLSSLVWLFAIRYLLKGKMKDAILAGISLGLAISTQYTAFIIGPLLFLAHLLRLSPKSKRFHWSSLSPVIIGYLVVPVVFFIGSPYALIHWHDFIGDVTELRSYGQGVLTSAEMGRLGWGVLSHFLTPLGPTSLGIAVLAFSLFGLFLFSKRRWMLLTIPLIWGALFLGCQSRQAGVINYAFSLYPGLFLLTGMFWIFIKVALQHRVLKPVILALVLIPPFTDSIRTDRYFLQEDTRVTAKKWIETSLPSGEKILMDQPHTGPWLQPSLPQIDRLYEKTDSLQHPRSTYFKLLRDLNLPGGYEIFRIDRTQQELISPVKRHTTWSKQGSEWLEVEAGLKPVREAGIKYVIWSSLGATPQNSPRLKKFFGELDREGILLQSFTSNNPYSPDLKIYKIS